MPKSRETCTECSTRRQRCDKGIPCGRCVKRGVADRCTRQWAKHQDSTRNRLESSSKRQRRRLSSTPPNHNYLDRTQAIVDRETLTPVTVQSEVTTLDFMTWTAPAKTSRDDRTNSDVLSSLPQLTAQNVDDQQESLAVLQLLLPNAGLMWKLINFHEKKLLWYHGCYHGPSFNSQVEERLRRQSACDEDVLQIQKHDLQWTALLFSVLAGSMTSANESLIVEWGLSTGERRQLDSQWYLAATASLRLGNYTSDHNMLGAQAIATLTMCAHTLGFSGDLHVHLGSAIRVAQALNVHRIRTDDVVINAASSDESRKTVLKKEIGRRLWSQLCIQDWFSIPLAEAHAIHRGHFTTRKPFNRDHISMELLDDSVPTYVSYSNYLYDIASLIADMHSKIVTLNTDYTRYQTVMEYDSLMRKLATRGRPHYFDVTVPIEDGWPWFVPWARRSLTICFAHKIMMIHRAFLKRSFTNSAFSLTRRTCIAASKTILNEAKLDRETDEPIIWIDHAFCIAAAITLALDVYHRRPDEPEHAAHRSLVGNCIYMLKKQADSTLAMRGVCLLDILLHNPSLPVIEDANSLSETSRRNIMHTSSAAPILNAIHHTSMNKSTTNNSHGLDPDKQSSNQSLEGLESFDDLFAELFPPQAGFSNAYLFEELLDLSLDR